MKFYARCERCGTFAEASHSDGQYQVYAGQIGAGNRGTCSWTLAPGWRTIDFKNFCGDCAIVIQLALDAAMQPV